jgi:dihydrofolate synthase/folylpolyglutamate synthase
MSRVIVTKNTSHRAADITELSDTAKQIFGSERITVALNLEEAIVRAIEQAKLENAINETNTAIVVTGSVVTAGEARTIVRKLKENKR